MKLSSSIIAAMLLFAGSFWGFSQGFVNLNFASPNLSSYPAESVMIPATDAFPYWMVSSPSICYDNYPLSEGSVDIMDSNFPYSPDPKPGTFYALLQTPEGEYSVSLGQSGMVPAGSESLTFLGSIGNMQITFNGQPLTFLAIGSSGVYTMYGANISAYAGESGDLLFTLPPFSSPGIIDDLQFSSSSVPEPGIYGLSAFGGLILGWRHWKNK